MIRSALPALLLLSACTSISTEQPVEGTSVAFVHAGETLHYRSLGTGEPALVLIHGWASDTRAWAHQIPDLMELGHVLVADLPGHGASSIPSTYSMAGFADAIVAMLDHAEIESAVLVAHSNGGPVALNVLERHPERVDGIVFVDAQVRNPIPPEVADAMFAPFEAVTWRESMTAMIETMPAPALSQADRDAIARMALSQSHETVVGGFYAAMAADAFPTSTIDRPVLYLMTTGPAWTEEYQAFAAELAPLSRWVEVPDTGHYIQMERPERLKAELARFLAEDLR